MTYSQPETGEDRVTWLEAIRIDHAAHDWKLLQTIAKAARMAGDGEEFVGLAQAVDWICRRYVDEAKAAAALDETRCWVAARLQSWERLLPGRDRATCRELYHALMDSPKLLVATAARDGNHGGSTT